jgi:hypothetical protein
MSTAELIEEIKRLGIPDRLKIIEATTALVREDLVAGSDGASLRMRAAALEAKSLYEPGGELAEWSDLDGEEVLDDPVGNCVNHSVQG